MGLQKFTLEQSKPYVEAIMRIGDLLALASMLPVLFECRHGSQLERLGIDSAKRKEARLKAAQQKQQGKQKQKGKQEKEEEDQEASPAKGWPKLPLGLPSVFFFILAEVISCWTMFVPGAKAPEAAAKGKEKAAGAAGPLGMLVEAIIKANQVAEAAAKKSMKSGEHSGLQLSMEKALLTVMNSLASREAFDAAHALLMLVALAAILVSMLGHYARPTWRALFNEGRSQLQCGLLVVVPVAIFGVLQGPSLLKVLKAVQEKSLFPAIPRPLRVVAILAAASPGPGKAPELPMFAVFQASSLMATISAEIANGRLASYLADFTHNENIWKAMMDSRAMTFLVPTLLSVLWLCIVHLRRNKGFLFVAMLLSMASSPLLLLNYWPQAAPHFGVGKDYAGGLVKVLSVLYVSISLSLLAAGGTITLMCGMVLANLLVRIHGHEAFAGLLA